MWFFAEHKELTLHERQVGQNLTEELQSPKKEQTPSCSYVIQWAERGNGLVHTDLQGTHAPGAGTSQDAGYGGRQERSDISQTVTEKLPAALPQADG